MDKYQKRYLKHQARKKNRLLFGENLVEHKYSEYEKNTLLRIIKNRKSQRIFKSKLRQSEIDEIIRIANKAPSSCSRHGVSIQEAPAKVIKLLIGGKGWCDKGSVLAFYADIRCYKSEYEKGFMPYLDTGFMAQNIYLYCEAEGLKCCFINPNTHNKYKLKNKLLTGAFAIGK